MYQLISSYPDSVKLCTFISQAFHSHPYTSRGYNWVCQWSNFYIGGRWEHYTGMFAEIVFILAAFILKLHPLLRVLRNETRLADEDVSFNLGPFTGKDWRV